MTSDRSEGWDDVVDDFLRVRSPIGLSTVTDWAVGALPESGDVLDVGCGSGLPIATTLVAEGLTVYGIDASARMVEEFERNLPSMPVRCEAAQDSDYFNRQFDGVVCIGLLFLLDHDDQFETLRRIASAITSGGSLLLSVPAKACSWQDSLTGRASRSLGHAAYEQHLRSLGMRLVDHLRDEGGNDYIDAVKTPPGRGADVRGESDVRRELGYTLNLNSTAFSTVLAL